jgi:hypothetical protein
MRLLLLIPAFIMHMLIMNKDILLQYVLTRYSLSLLNATYILTLRSSSILALLLIMYPALNHLPQTKFAFHPQRAELTLGRACAVATSLGLFLTGIAPSIPLLIAAMVVNTLSSELHLYLRSLATSLVEAHHVARLNTLVSWIDTIGLMVGSPLLAWLFERVLKLAVCGWICRSSFALGSFLSSPFC